MEVAVVMLTSGVHQQFHSLCVKSSPSAHLKWAQIAQELEQNNGLLSPEYASQAVLHEIAQNALKLRGRRRLSYLLRPFEMLRKGMLHMMS